MFTGTNNPQMNADERLSVDLSFKERWEVAMGFGWLSEENLLARCQFCVGWRLYAIGTPGCVGYAIFVEERAAFVFAVPGRCPVR